MDFEAEAPALDWPDVRVVLAPGPRSWNWRSTRPSTPAAALIARIVAAHAVDDIHVEEPLIEEVIARFYDKHGAGEA